MRVLIVKTSSMGDIIHTLPALTDAGRVIPGIRFDWLVEENFSEIPSWHPLVDKVIPVAIRRWRKNIFSVRTRAEVLAVRAALRAEKYDLIIDAQGLLKSVWLTFLARGVRAGFDRPSAREALASFFYQKKASASWSLHAVTRARQLFAQVLNYPLQETVPDYGLPREQFVAEEKRQQKYLVFLHGTTWATKHWPETYWQQLAKLANQHGFSVKLPWGSPAEHERAKRIAASAARADVLPRLALREIAVLLSNAQAIVAVDTGLGHLAAALAVPTVSLYGATDPALTGALGKSQVHLKAAFPCSPCFSRECTYRATPAENLLQPPCFTGVTPEKVWSEVLRIAGLGV